MLRKWRPILATILVIILAGFIYLRNMPARPAQIDLADLNFTFDEKHPKLGDLPPEVRALDGHEVAVLGRMIPMDEAVNIRKFAIVPVSGRLDGEGPPPEITQMLIAISSRPLLFIPEDIRAHGRFHFQPTYEDGFLTSLYRIDIDHVDRIPDQTARWPWAVIGGGVLLLAVWQIRGFKRRRLQAGGSLHRSRI